MTDCPDVFLYVYAGAGSRDKKRMCYARFSMTELGKHNGELQWVRLQPKAPSYDKYNGFVLLRAELSEQAPTVNSYVPVRSPMQEPQERDYRINARIYQAKGLKSTDANGLSDPYCVLKLGAAETQTSFVKETLNPQFYQALDLKISLPTNLALAPQLSVLMYDKDRIGSDDLIGRLFLPVEGLTESFPEVPQWRELEDGGGKVLCSFQLLREEMAARLDFNKDQVLKPRGVPALLDCTLIGLRGLPASLFMQPLGEVCIRIHISGVPYDRERHKSAYSKSPSSRNPNFLQTLSFDSKGSGGAAEPGLLRGVGGQKGLQLTVDPIFWGSVEIRAYSKNPLLRGMLCSCDVPFEELVKGELLEELSDMQTEFDINKGKRGGGKGDGKKKRFGRKSKEEKDRGKKGAEGAEEKPKSTETTPLLADDSGAGVGDGGATKGGGAPPAAGGSGGGPGGKANSKDGEALAVVPHELEKLFKRGGKIQEFQMYHGEQHQPFGKLKCQFNLSLENGQPRKGADLQALFKLTRVIVRVYVLTGVALAPKDDDGSSDPYYKLRCGNYSLDTRSDCKYDTLDPEFYKCHEITGLSVPGDNMLTLEMWDWDQIASDDIIGQTTIDLEERFLSPEWQAMQPRPPVEYRTLWNPAGTAQQGRVEMIVEIVDEAENRKQPVPRRDIAPPKPQKFEIRLIVWGCKDVALKDQAMFGEAGSSDVFVKAHFEGKHDAPEHCHRTDTHWKSTGECSFNWRMKFPVELPYKNGPMRLKFSMWDEDAVGEDDMICEGILDMSRLFKQALKGGGKGVNFDKQMLDFFMPDTGDEVQGRMELSLQILSDADAKRKAAGEGQKAPNENPKLPKPKGRISRMPKIPNPMSMMLNMGGNVKLYCAVFCVVLIVGLIVVLPIVKKIMFPV